MATLGCWTGVLKHKEIIMHGRDRHTTTILSIIDNMSTTCFGQYYFWPSSGWMKLSEKTTRYIIWYSITISAKWSELLSQYCAGDKIEKNEMGWACGAYGWGEEVYRVLVGKLGGRRPLGLDGWIILGRISRRWDVGIMDWIGLAQNRVGWRTFVSAVMNLRVQWNAGNFLTSCKAVSFSRRTLHHGVSKYNHQCWCK